MLGEKTVFFKFDFFFLTFDPKHDNDKWSHSFCGYKKTIFFSDHSSGKIYRQNDDVPIVHFSTNFQRKSRRPYGPWEKKILIQNNSKDAQEQKLSTLFYKSFLFWTNEKKKWAHKRKFSPSRQCWCKKLTFFWLLLLLTFVLFL